MGERAAEQQPNVETAKEDVCRFRPHRPDIETEGYSQIQNDCQVARCFHKRKVEFERGRMDVVIPRVSGRGGVERKAKRVQKMSDGLVGKKSKLSHGAL